MAPTNTKSQIIGLLTTKRLRGLQGEQAIQQWVTAALEVLLQAELERMESNAVVNRS